MTRRADGEPVAATDRFRAWRRARRRRYLRPLLAVVGVVALLAIGAWVALGSSAFALREVRVEGVSRLSAQQVANQAGLSRALAAGQSLLSIDPHAVERRVARLRPVAAVDVSRRWPHDIVIKVTERRAVATAQDASGWVLIDLSGVAFATVSSRPTGLVQVRVDASMAGDGATRARAAIAVYRALPPPLRRRVSELVAPSPEAISFRLRDGREVVWGSPSDSPRKVVVLRALLHRKAVRYDVSAPDVAVTS